MVKKGDDITVNKITRTIKTTTVSFVPTKKFMQGQYMNDDVIKVYCPGQLHEHTAERRGRRELARKGIDESVTMVDCVTTTNTYTMSLDKFIAYAECE